MASGTIDFAKLEFDGLTKARLLRFCTDHRLGLAASADPSTLTADDFGFHLTVTYSRVNSPAFQPGEFDVEPYRLRPLSYDVFGPEADILVLKLHPDEEIVKLAERYRDVHGHVSDFGQYAPHVSIRGSDAATRSRIREIPLPDFDLFADRLIQKHKAA